MNNQHIADSIRAIYDYPKPGIIFRDITTLIGDRKTFSEVIEIFKMRYEGQKIDLCLI